MGGPKESVLLDILDWMKTTSIIEAMDLLGNKTKLDEIRGWVAYRATNQDAAQNMVLKRKLASSKTIETFSFLSSNFHYSE